MHTWQWLQTANKLDIGTQSAACCRWPVRETKTPGRTRGTEILAMLDTGWRSLPCQQKKIVLTPLQIMQCTSDGQIQIAIRFKSRLNHLWRFDFSKRFDLNVHDSIGIRFEIHGDSIWKSAKSQNTICLFLRNLRVSNCTFAFGFV